MDDPRDDLMDDDDFSSDEMPLRPPRSLDPDAILDSLVPSSIDWRDTVRRHPLGSITAVGLVGYLVGRTKGPAILAGITAALSAAMMRQLSDVFEGDFFDF